MQNGPVRPVMLDGDAIHEEPVDLMVLCFERGRVDAGQLAEDVFKRFGR